MQYISTNNSTVKVNFKQATINGQPPGGGLYFPETIPMFPREMLEGIEHISDEEIAFQIIKPYVGDTIPAGVLQQFVKETINFPIPLIPVNESIFSLELYHGPTLAFKDIGARFMSRCLSFFVKDNQKKVTVLVATSGDTGGAVASGFYDVPNVDVVILYPSGKVSTVQEKQLTTFGKNIRALEVAGTFDDCQQMVKQAFADKDLGNRIFLTSANSINVARWLPQQFYYFFACKQWKNKSAPPVIAVPSGNFGNICAGLLSQASGLPVQHFIAACNANDVIPNFLESKNYLPQKAIATISNAMDVGDPSNFVRIMKMFSQDIPALVKKLSAVSISDEQTRATIKKVYEEHGYLLDPHAAVSYTALYNYLQLHKPHAGIILETAHPVKFYDVVEPVIGIKVPVPAALQHILKKEKKALLIKNNFQELKEYLLAE